LNGGHIDIPQALCKSGEAMFGTTIQLITGRLINPRQDHYGDLALGFFLIIVKKRHQAGLRVEQALPLGA
jgi:hypothetical protein